MPRKKDPILDPKLAENLTQVAMNKDLRLYRSSKKFQKLFHKLEIQRLNSLGYRLARYQAPLFLTKGYRQAKELAKYRIEDLNREVFSSDEASRHTLQELLVTFNKGKSEIIKQELEKNGVNANRRTCYAIYYKDQNIFKSFILPPNQRSKKPKYTEASTRLENLQIKALKTSYHLYHDPYTKLVFEDLSISQLFILVCNFHNFYEIEKLKPI